MQTRFVCYFATLFALLVLPQSFPIVLFAFVCIVRDLSLCCIGFCKYLYATTPPECDASVPLLKWSGFPSTDTLLLRWKETPDKGDVKQNISAVKRDPSTPTTALQVSQPSTYVKRSTDELLAACRLIVASTNIYKIKKPYTSVVKQIQQLKTTQKDNEKEEATTTSKAATDTVGLAESKVLPAALQVQNFVHARARSANKALQEQRAMRKRKERAVIDKRGLFFLSLIFFVC